MEKKINYLARTFDDIKAELIRFSKTNYPEVADSFDDGSVGSWMIDLVAAVGDDLSYHTDRMAQEMNINTANLEHPEEHRKGFGNKGSRPKGFHV